MNKLVIATRSSALALWQAHYVKGKILENNPNLCVELLEITSSGDKILDRPLALIGGKGHFTKELEEAMLDGRADMAVHSLKDVPTYIPDGLELAAIMKRQDQSDVFLSCKYPTFESLPRGARIGTTSLRRRMQLLRQRPDLEILDLRGNINTRIKKLQAGEYDAIVLAFIGLERLNLITNIPYSQKFSLKTMIPPMGQASLGIEIVATNLLAKEIALGLNDTQSFLCAKIERDFIAQIGAGCSAPVAVNAVINKNEINVRCMIGFADGTNILEEFMVCSLDEYADAGMKLARSMIDKGAMEILHNAQEQAFKSDITERL